MNGWWFFAVDKHFISVPNWTELLIIITIIIIIIIIIAYCIGVSQDSVIG